MQFLSDFSRMVMSHTEINQIFSHIHFLRTLVSSFIIYLASVEKCTILSKDNLIYGLSMT